MVIPVDSLENRSQKSFKTSGSPGTFTGQTSRMEPEEIAVTLGLRPLPVEGGLWTQTWRDENCTAIYYLLVDPAFSALHRLRQPEIWAYHAGAPAQLTLINDEAITRPVLGPDLAAGQRPQVVVPAGTWQGCRTLGDWSLFGTFTAPAYSDDSVEFAVAGDFPEHATEIRALCVET
jgi:uncharacterized protein